MNDKGDQPRAVRIDSWGFETEPRRGISMFGVFLIIFGLLLVAGTLFQAAQVGSSALFLALGIVLLLVWLRDRSQAALFVGIFVTALALSDLLTGLGVVKGDGWGTLFLGIGVLFAALVRFQARRSWGWVAVVGGLLCLWGGSEVASVYTGWDYGRLVGPVVVILIGVWLVTNTRSWRF